MRSFLGLVNHCGRFIPKQSAIAEPLRRFTSSICTWTWGKEQDGAFKLLLKDALASSQNMAYFSQEADTQVKDNCGCQSSRTWSDLGSRASGLARSFMCPVWERILNDK